MTASIISLRWKHLRLKTCRHLSHRQARHPKDGNRLLCAYVLLPAKLRGKRANHPSNRFCSTSDQRPDAARYRWNNFFNRASRSPQYFLQLTADTAVDFLPLLLFRESLRKTMDKTYPVLFTKKYRVMPSENFWSKNKPTSSGMYFFNFTVLSWICYSAAYFQTA